MKTPVVIATVLTLAITGAVPAVAATDGNDSHIRPERLTANHNEVLATSQER